MDRDIASITKVRGWMPRPSLHLGYDPSTDPPRTTLEYKGIKRMQRGKRGDQISHGDKFLLRKKLYVFHGEESQFVMTSPVTRSVTYSSSGKGRESSKDLEPLLGTIALYRQRYGISPQHEEAWSDQLASSDMFEDSGDLQTALFSIFRGDSDYATYQAHQLDHHFQYDSLSVWP